LLFAEISAKLRSDMNIAERRLECITEDRSKSG
jgi:hypothetical protein